jgi:hypothetical protein
MKVRALQTVILGPGTVLTLSERQAARRAHLLLPEGGGRYRSIASVQFKTDEEFGVDVALPKALADAIETDAAPTKRNPAKKPKRVTLAPAIDNDAPVPAVWPAPTLVDPAQLDIG